MPLEGRSSWTPGGVGWFATLSTWQPLRSTRRPVHLPVTSPEKSEMTETKWTPGIWNHWRISTYHWFVKFPSSHPLPGRSATFRSWNFVTRWWSLGPGLPFSVFITFSPGSVVGTPRFRHNAGQSWWPFVVFQKIAYISASREWELIDVRK